MAGRGPQTFKKRQKEQQRKERQEEKRAKRLQQKAEGVRPPEVGGADEDDLNNPNLPVPELQEADVQDGNS